MFARTHGPARTDSHVAGRGAVDRGYVEDRDTSDRDLVLGLGWFAIVESHVEQPRRNGWAIGQAAGARVAYLTAARYTVSLPEERYLEEQAARIDDK